jgi:8-oxo-dGTP diphosphatase
MAYSSDHAPFAVTVDLVVLTIRDDRLCALVSGPGDGAEGDRRALPGGYVRLDEDLRHAAERQLRHAAAVEVDGVHLEQLATYGSPDRDQRQRAVSVAWLAVAPRLPDPAAGTGATEAHWMAVDDLLVGTEPLAFDHEQILRDGVDRAQSKLEYSTIGTAFCEPEFTVAELRRVYEVVWGRRLDPGNFHRKVTGAEGFVVPTGAGTRRGSRRSSRLYRRGPAQLLHPPLTRRSFHPL